MYDILDSVDFEININNARELYDKCGFSTAEIIRIAFHESGLTHFAIDDIECELQLITLFTDTWCSNGYFSVFITTRDENESNKIQEKHHSRQIIYNQLCKLADYMNENINVNIPINNFDNIIYNENNDCFYVKIGTPTPDMVKLTVEFNATIDELTHI